MKIRFKLIPFLISILIVIGITFGICWYSYHGYEGNKLKFLDEYFNVDDYEKQETSDLIKNYVEMQFSKYAKGTEKVSILNPDTEEKVTSSTDNKDVLSFNNGTIHVPGYFDIDVYATGSLVDDEYIYNYYFFFYNINYKNSSFSPSDLEMIVVDGIGRTENEDNENEDSKFGLDLLDDAYTRKYDDDTNNNPSTTLGAMTAFSYVGDVEVTASYPIFDNGFTNDSEREEDHYVFNMSPKTDINHNSITNPIDSNGNPIKSSGNISFTLVDTTKDTNTRLFTGTITQVTSMEELEYSEGCQKDPMKSKSFGIIIAGRVALHGGIAFVLSGIIAFLFYLIWMDPADTSGKSKKNNNKTTKKKE